MNQWNELLPPIVSDGLHHDEHESLRQINKSVSHIRALLNGNGELVSNKDAGKLFRQINTHSSLKYTYTVSTTSAVQFNHPLQPVLHTFPLIECISGYFVEPADGSVSVQPLVFVDENLRFA